MLEPRSFLRDLFDAAVAAGAPARVRDALPEPGAGRTVVVGAGKASAAMARTVEQAWPGSLTGLVITRYGHAVACDRVAIVEAGHPMPDATGTAAAARMLELVRNLSPEDLVIGVFSGGGSALMSLPPPGVSLADMQAITHQLLRSGARIGDINCVRRHVSAINGGRLAAASFPARVCNLLISDVPGDAPLDIASGPLVVDPTTCAQALSLLERFSIVIPDAVRAGLVGGGFESVKPGDARLARVETKIIASAAQSLAAAADLAGRRGVRARVLSDRLEGEARLVARDMMETARRLARAQPGSEPPQVLLSGGETTVTVTGHGRGGRNVEFALALAIAAEGDPRIHALAADTDGIDGTEPIAGAYVGPDTFARAAALGLDARGYLERNDAHSFFEALGDSIITGPTRTNVNDFRAVLVL
jgi:hydroxypyruvate reductase